VPHGKGSGVVGYNVQAAVETKHHLIVAHEVTNTGSDRGQLAPIGLQIEICEESGITTYLPKPMTSPSKANGRFGKADFIYIHPDDEYQCPAGERLRWRQTTFEKGINIHQYWSDACSQCA
jgi:hypothetical protein